MAIELWMCRLLVGLRARPVALDIGDLDGEAFELYRVDFGVLGTLDLLPSASCGAIGESRLFGSESRAAYGPATDHIRAEIHRRELRLLQRDGIIIHSDGGRRLAGRGGEPARRLSPSAGRRWRPR